MPENPALPIDDVLDEISHHLAVSNRLVLAAPPGAGKTTKVPLHLLNAPWLDGNKIIMLEPRRIAARRAAERMASMLGEKVGESLGELVGDELLGENVRSTLAVVRFVEFDGSRFVEFVQFPF